MWRLLALLLAAPAAAQTLTVDFAALDDVRRGRSRPHLVVHVPALLRIEAPSPLELSSMPTLTPRPTQSDTARALLGTATSSPNKQAVLVLAMAEPPRPVRARAMPIELARFAPASPAPVAPHAPARIEPASAPVLDAARLLLPFAPELDLPPRKDPITLREAMMPVLAAFPVFERVAMLALDLPKLAVAQTALLHFAPMAASLDEAGRAALDAMAAQLERSKSGHVRLLVSLQAGDDPDAARRLALARMLAVRAYLISRGIAASRLDARATVAARSDEAARIALLD